MDNSQLLYQFVKGQTNAANEDYLFARLAEDRDLRLELKTLVIVDSFVSHNRTLFSVPKEYKKEVFAAAGIASPAGTTNASHARGWIQSAARSAGIVSKPLAASIISIIMTAAVLLWIFIPQINALKDTVASLNGKISGLSANVPLVTSSESNPGVPINTGKPQVKYIYRTVYTADNKPGTPQSSLPASSPDADVTDNTDNSSGISNSAGKLTASLVGQTGLLTDRRPLLINDNKYEKSGEGNYEPLVPIISKPGNERFSVELRSSQQWLSPKPEISPAEYADFNNTAVSLFYSPGQDFSVGLDIRQETFYLVYDMEENGKTYRYEQQPNFTTVGLAGRYNPQCLEFYNFNPFVQITAGFNRVGLTGRLMSGLMISPYENISFILGYEYSAMMFNSQGRRYTSGKTGLNYGITYKF